MALIQISRAYQRVILVAVSGPTPMVVQITRLVLSSIQTAAPFSLKQIRRIHQSLGDDVPREGIPFDVAAGVSNVVEWIVDRDRAAVAEERLGKIPIALLQRGEGSGLGQLQRGSNVPLPSAQRRGGCRVV